MASKAHGSAMGSRRKCARVEGRAMRQSSVKAIGWLSLTTLTALLTSALCLQECDAWTEAQLRRNAEPAPFALHVRELYGPPADDDGDRDDDRFGGAVASLE